MWPLLITTVVTCKRADINRLFDVDLVLSVPFYTVIYPSVSSSLCVNVMETCFTFIHCHCIQKKTPTYSFFHISVNDV